MDRMRVAGFKETATLGVFLYFCMSLHFNLDNSVCKDKHYESPKAVSPVQPRGLCSPPASPAASVSQQSPDLRSLYLLKSPHASEKAGIPVGCMPPTPDPPRKDLVSSLVCGLSVLTSLATVRFSGLAVLTRAHVWLSPRVWVETLRLQGSSGRDRNAV